MTSSTDSRTDHPTDTAFTEDFFAVAAPPAVAPSASFRLLSVAIPRPLAGLFTYRLPDELAARVEVGGWVRVPFGRGTTHAFIVEAPRAADDVPEGLDPAALKAVLEVGEGGAVLPPDVLALCRWAHDYYQVPLGEMLQCAVPPAALGLKSARREARAIKPYAAEAVRHELTAEQAGALAVLEAVRVRDGDALKAGLLNGVTGSGKTELYLELARRTLAEGRGVMLLVPEIALTSQLHRRFEEGLGTTVALWHSAVADGKRRDLSAALRRGEIRVVVGARSAVFAPVANLGLLVVDEEHDSTYKQEDRVRYHARDLAVVRAKHCGALVVLGSATPSLETRERAREGKYVEAKLDHRVSAGGLPAIELVDLCIEPCLADTQALISEKVVEALRATIAAGEQAMVFLNRRGFANFLICEDCRKVHDCPDCSISLTVHKARAQLRCHVCGFHARIPDFCPGCQGLTLKAVGAGTESLELDLPRLIPEARILRLDRDQVTSTARLEQILDDFRAGKANVLLGTQMLVKGHDFPGVTLVVVMLADAFFSWPDFRAPERAYQVLRQVAGRAGRGERPGKVLIQTYDPEHAVLQVIQGRAGEAEFLEGERELRQALGYPPFGRMARLRFESVQSTEAKERAQSVAQALAALQAGGQAVFDLLGPSEAFLEKAKGIHRWDVLLRSRKIGDLQRAVATARHHAARQKWPITLDIDPQGS